MDFLQAYIDYASFSEAPKRMHAWSGVAAIAGALRRRVWIDMKYFTWTPGFYIIMVAPPGIVSKSTTINIAARLLRQVPGINFGPDCITWPALVVAFSECSESFEINGEFYAQSALTLVSSELGNLVNPADRDMIDLLVNLWDSQQGAFKKATKGSGKDVVENPWINLIACTTPSWIAGNFPEYVIGGGFTSRCMFVYAEVKDKFVAYPHLHVPADLKEKERKLVQDLERISMLAGEYKLTPGALKYGEEWYETHYNGGAAKWLQDDRFAGYLARKQTHIHKTAIVLAAAQRDELIITAEDLATANHMVTDLEQDLPKVFAKIGRTEESIQAERFIKHVQINGPISYETAYQYIHMHFPQSRDFEGIVTGAIKSGQIAMEGSAAGFVFKASPKKLLKENSDETK